MPNRFAGKYDDYARKARQASYQDPTQQHNAENQRDFDQFLGSMASMALPIAGTAIGGAVGGIPGAQVGGQVGNAAGQAAGQFGYNQGESQMDKIRKKELERQALLQAIMSSR